MDEQYREQNRPNVEDWLTNYTGKAVSRSYEGCAEKEVVRVAQSDCDVLIMVISMLYQSFGSDLGGSGSSANDSSTSNSRSCGGTVELLAS